MKRLIRILGKNTFIILAGAGLFIVNINVFSQAPVQILPLGNSITFDDNSLDKTNPRPVGDRIAYRYTLFQLLHDAGYKFDFVGSENSGNNYFNDPQFDDNAGFPGIETWQLTSLINTGYNAVTGVWVTQGPYLNDFPADIILLHIGTNNLIDSASDVEALLDTIRSYQPDVLILVARIINRSTYDAWTTVFNNHVESMVSSRRDNRIRMVDMEFGANIDYSTDMADTLHPNHSGFDKMAYKWFEAIENLNQAPETVFIPEQISSESSPFPDLSLDDYVSDHEDTDAFLSWTFSKEPGSHLEVSIDENRILHVVPFESWHGSETLKLRVEDSGNGAFPKNDSVEVGYTINNPPVITSSPAVSEIHVNEEYQYVITASDVDEEDSLEFYATHIPGWLSFMPEMGTAALRGIASENDAGSDSIKLMVSDGHYEVYQEFALEVLFPDGIPHDHAPLKMSYPNPVRNDITIQTRGQGHSTIEIVSLNGKLLYRTEMEGTSFHIDLSSLRRGPYFITVKSEDFTKTEKIFKLF